MAPVRQRGPVEQVGRVGGDTLMVGLAAAHAAALIAFPSAPVIALGLWWSSNTISHNFIHRPFFRRRSTNRIFAAYLSVVLGIPQSLWRDRHLAHHAGADTRVRFSSDLIVQAVLVLLLWTAIAARAPGFLLSVYLPGYIAGLLLCAVHGYYEHHRGASSHYGKIYNVLFFNDGYHVEHHAHPEMHWANLSDCRDPTARVSGWPAPLRWMECDSLQTLERLVLKSRVLQRFVLRTHARAWRGLVGQLPRPERIVIVGGGLFPRTALILRELLPGARITIIDANRRNLDRARAWLDGANIEFIHARYTGSQSGACSLLVIPLSFEGDRNAIYTRPPAPAVIVHDWIWRRRGASRVVSLALLKRINLVRSE